MSNGLSAGDFKPVQANDFKPVAAQAAGPSASDFKPVQAADFKPVQASAPQAGALPFDDIISREAEAAGIPASFALNIGHIESGGTRDRARATSPAGAVGVMQLMPGTAKDLGVQNITDPTENIRGGVKYLAQLYKKYGGDTRAVAAAYNMGPGAYDEYRAGKRAMPEETANYIEKIAPLPADAPQAHKDLGSAGLLHVKHVVDTFNRAQRAGKDPFKAIGRTAELRGTANLEHNLQTHLQWFKNHTLEGVADVAGGLQRGVGQVEYNMVQNNGKPNFLAGLADGVWDAAINPTDKTQARTTRAPLDLIEQETQGRAHFPTHKEIDNAIHANVWKPMQGAASVIAKGGEDMGAQFISDPLSLPGGLTEKSLNLAGGVARAVHGLMPVQAALNWVHLPQLAGTLEEMGSRAFGVRRDLDAAGFTREGKQARIAMENAELTRKAHNIEGNRAVASDPQAAAERYVNYIAEHGKGRTAVEARIHPLHTAGVSAPATGHAGPTPDFHADVAELVDPTTDPKRREELLHGVSDSIFRNQLSQRSEQFFGSNPNLFRGSLGQLKNIGTEEASNVQKFMDASPLKTVREIGKRAIIWNPAPHGLKNVGTLAYLAGGLPAVARGLAAMTHPPSAAEIKELEDIGALPKYLGQASRNGIEAKSQAALERMELGWRYGLKQTLDKKLGVPVTEKDKLLRGYLINNKVGDYRNQSAFVKMFQALGGPFVAFRLGIIPARVAEAAIKNPERIVAATRGQEDFQKNRDPHAQRQNEFVLGGPVNDFSELLSDPKQYLANTLGAMGNLGREPSAGGQGLFQSAVNLAGSYIPGVAGAEDLAKTIAGHERPGQKVQLSDQLLDAILSQFGTHYKKKITPKQEAMQRKRIVKGDI